MNGDGDGSGDSSFAEDEDVEAALAALSAADVVRLTKASTALSRSLSLTGDLLSIAVERTLAGTRRWNTALPFAQHLYGAMRSIADERRDAQRRLLAKTAPVVAADAPATTDDAETLLVRKAELVQAKAAAEELMRIFDGEKVATDILFGLSEGLSAAQIRAEFGIDLKTYNSTRRQIRRKADERFPRGFVDAN